MIHIDGYDIAVTRGDSMPLRIDLSGRDLPDGSRAVFTVKKSLRDEQPLVEKLCDASGEVVSLLLTPQDTDLPPGHYVWDVRLVMPMEDGTTEVFTPMDHAMHIVLQAVGSV